MIIKAGPSKIFVGSSTRDVSTTGNQAITGVGFKPSGIYIDYRHSSNAEVGQGMTDGTTDKAMYHYAGFGNSFNNLIYVDIAYLGTNIFRADLSSFDSDGFTLNWAHIAGSPTGTCTFHYMCFG